MKPRRDRERQSAIPLAGLVYEISSIGRTSLQSSAIIDSIIQRLSIATINHMINRLSEFDFYFVVARWYDRRVPASSLVAKHRSLTRTFAVQAQNVVHERVVRMYTCVLARRRCSVVMKLKEGKQGEMKMQKFGMFLAIALLWVSSGFA